MATINEIVSKACDFFRANYRGVVQPQRVIGVDLGQKHDYTAIAILEESFEYIGRDGITYECLYKRHLCVRYLERVPLTTSYPKVAERLREVVDHFPVDERPKVMVVDGTCVGRPVVDFLLASKLGIQLVPVSITPGGQEHNDGYWYYVPKRDLITHQQLLLQQKILKVAGAMPERKLLEKEWEQMRVKVSLSGNEQMACWREGEHDDLVLAVGLAVWWWGKADN